MTPMLHMSTAKLYASELPSDMDKISGATYCTKQQLLKVSEQLRHLSSSPAEDTKAWFVGSASCQTFGTIANPVIKG